MLIYPGLDFIRTVAPIKQIELLRVGVGIEDK